MKKRLAYLIISLVAISALAAGSYYFYYENSVKDIFSSLELIQESLAETVIIKEAGDLLQAKNKNLTADYTWAKVETIAVNLANQIASLNGNYRLTEYKKVATIWTVKIREAAKDQKTWPDVPAQPGDFIIKLRNNEAGQLLIESLAKINELVQFGSDAVTRKDKQTMRYVAAKLLVQKHWLNGLAHYEEAGYFAGLIAPAYVYAATELIDCSTATLKDRPWCILRANRQLTDIQNKIDGLLVVAIAYSRGNAGAEKNWNEATKQLMDMFKEQGLLSLGTPLAVAEIMQNNNLLPPDTSTTLLKVQTYQDNCLANGGKLGGVDKSNGRLPTSENGNYCKFKDQEKNCWNFLTNSGSYFAGGDDGCEQHNVLPADTGPNSPAVEGSPSIEPPAPTTGAKTEAPKTPAKTSPKLPPVNLPKIPNANFYFSGPGYTLTGQVGEKFEHSFCYPDLYNVSDLCGTANTTVPSGGHPPYHFQLESGFPPFGLTLNLNGILNGTPTAEGVRDFKVCAVDLDGKSMCTPVKVEVKPATPTPVQTSYMWHGKYEVTAWSCTCSDEKGNTWASGPPHSIWEVDERGQLCGVEDCAIVSPSGGYFLYNVYRQAWGNTYQKINLTFSLSGDQATANGAYWQKSERVAAEFSTQVEPGTTVICNSTWSLSRYSN